MELFQGALALFLLKMGLITTEQLGALKQDGPFLTAFGVFMPLVAGGLGALLGQGLGLSVGGITLLAVLGASASYIAVPAAMRVALPQANATLSMAASLGITFPFNVLAGIRCICCLPNGCTAAEHPSCSTTKKATGHVR